MSALHATIVASTTATAASSRSMTHRVRRWIVTRRRPTNHPFGRCHAAPRSVRSRGMRVLDDLPWIYGAACHAAADEAAGRHVTERVVRDARPGTPRRALVAEAVRLAVRSATPVAPFDRLPPREREALALVRLAGMAIEEVAAVTGEDTATVKRRLTAGLQMLATPQPVAPTPAAASVRRMPRPRLGFGSAASRARGAHAS
jgi:DNA-directed RNA polymerase specialized sigma24 family protein